MENESRQIEPYAQKPRFPRARLAWIVALAVDALQIGLLPLFGGGAISPLVDALDVVTAIVMTTLLGWHWAFLPTFVAELLPIVDLVPTWTLAVFLVTRRLRGPAAPHAPRT